MGQDVENERTTKPDSAASALSAGFGFTVGQEVTVTRQLWEPPDDCHPGGLLALPGDRLIVRVVRESGQFPISVSHHDRTDGMTFQVAPDEVTPNAKVSGTAAASSPQAPLD